MKLIYKVLNVINVLMDLLLICQVLNVLMLNYKIVLN